MTTQSSNSEHDKRFPIVGRDQRVDLTKYTVKVHGRDVIDYEKLRVDDPELYKEILAGELEANRREEEELEEILFLSIPRPTQVSDEHKADILTFSNDSGQPMNYASRVLPGQTLAEAVENDLHTDFTYDGDFQIKNHHFYDTTPDKKGTLLPRLVVIIKVNRFSTNALHPAGLQVQWSLDAATHLSAYRFKL